MRRRMTMGALFGGAFAGVGLVVGLARGAVFLLSGGDLRFDDFLVPVLYVMGFCVAGATIGALWPMRRSIMGRFALGLLGAGIVLTFITRALSGPFTSWGAAEAFGITCLTLFFGLIVGYKLGDDR